MWKFPFVCSCDRHATQRMSDTIPPSKSSHSTTTRPGSHLWVLPTSTLGAVSTHCMAASALLALGPEDSELSAAILCTVWSCAAFLAAAEASTHLECPSSAAVTTNKCPQTLPGVPAETANLPLAENHWIRQDFFCFVFYFPLSWPLNPL